jgi:predicted ATPase
MYIRSLKIRSLRCFDKVELDLQYPGRPGQESLNAPNVNLLLGNNGSGKTTVLRGAALAALSPVISKSGYVPNHMIRRQKTSATAEARVELHPQDLGRVKIGRIKSQAQKLGVSIRKRGDVEYIEDPSIPAHMAEMFDDNSPAFLVVGYGATRRVEDAASFSPNEQLKRRLLRYQRIAGLFESHIALTPLTIWLPHLRKANPGRYTQVVHLIDRLLPEGDAFAGKQEKGLESEYLFRVRGASVPFSALSDGYRAYIGWIADLLYHLSTGSAKGARLTENRGLVLVDEIDLHLHPEWQRNVISTLSRTLPNLQFVFSTHSPIVAGSLHNENIFVMETGAKGESHVMKYSERIYGLDAQQVLLSPYFGLESTRAPGFVDEVRDLSRQLKPGRPDIALRIMQKLAGSSNGDEDAPPAGSHRTAGRKPVPRGVPKPRKQS